MSHHIYKTEAIVLGSRNFGESNKLLYLLTKDLGFIVASAQGVRELKSKLRGIVQDFSRVNIDLVRGKEMWRVTNAEHIRSYGCILESEEKKMLIARIFRLLLRLLQGEERNSELFDAVSKAFIFFERANAGNDELSLAEIAINLKILQSLGYGSEEVEIQKLASMEFSADFLRALSENRRKAIAAINRGIKESQL